VCLLGIGIFLFELVSAIVDATQANQPAEIRDYQHPQKTALLNSIKLLREYPEGETLIVRIPETQKYIQFFKNEELLLMVFPRKKLAESEVERAESYFQQIQIFHKNTECRTLLDEKFLSGSD